MLAVTPHELAGRVRAWLRSRILDVQLYSKPMNRFLYKLISPIATTTEEDLEELAISIKMKTAPSTC